MTEKVPTMVKHSGMGAIPHTNGVTFRVWAPHAENVYLIGTFNSWDEKGANDSVVMVVNMTNQSRDAYIIGLSRKGLWKTRFNSDSYNYDPNFYNHPAPDVEANEEESNELPCSGEISIGPYTVVIFSQDE
ncbi:MAG: alpha amylase C-terminal domain-containing protein [Proteobacteria bacterium]|nr:alpha amylase C-terminal domain-containing protein [Pseudomonadota bacterium]